MYPLRLTALPTGDDPLNRAFTLRCIVLRHHVVGSRDQGGPPPGARPTPAGGQGRRRYPGPVTKTDWNPILRQELDKPYWTELQQFVHQERTNHRVFPPHDEVFAALHLTPYALVKVLIVGQDPYHGPGQAHGLCFSVRPGVAVPPSLDNIFRELESDLGVPRPNHGSLEHWARQGVLLLNTTLTVRAHKAGSHQGK